ncbi:MAG: ribbon-helix-helix protein, CopG family [Deltaproteobacteria bacterium]|nr:ribbon-helix-helix protein, CopG family [Deltaproteobacteria bacterium]
MTTQMIIRIEREVKNRLDRLARLEGKSTSEIVRELIEERIRERDIGAYIENLWDRIGGKLRSKGATTAAINRAVKEARKNR